MRFNPPPNWPRFPNGWTPPPGWQPDPSWPPPPHGWPMWVPEGAEDTFVLTAPAPAPMHAYHAPVRTRRVPWHRRTLTVTLLLIFFFPVGLVLLWLRNDWSVRRRGLITAVVAVCVIIALPSQSPPPTATIQAGPVSGSSGSPQATTATTSPAAVPATLPSQSANTTSAAAAAASPTSAKTSAAAVVAAPRTTTAPVHTTAVPTTHSAKPAPPTTTTTTTTAAPQKQSLCGAPSNPWGYNFCGNGGYITSPNSDVCSYFDCIDNFWNGVGYMVECKDGTYSMSGGRSGACSRHGGEDQPVYSG